MDRSITDAVAYSAIQNNAVQYSTDDIHAVMRAFVRAVAECCSISNTKYKTREVADTVLSADRHETKQQLLYMRHLHNNNMLHQVLYHCDCTWEV